jgi:hypothetical protein
MEDILLTLPRLVPTVRAVAIYSLSGEPIAVAGRIPDSSLPELPLKRDGLELFAPPHGKTAIHLTRRINDGRRDLAQLVFVLDTEEFAEIQLDPDSPDQSNETMLGWRAPDGEVKLLTDLRYPDAVLQPAAGKENPDAAEPVSSLMGLNTARGAALFDYRGKEVIAAPAFSSKTTRRSLMTMAAACSSRSCG